MKNDNNLTDNISRPNIARWEKYKMSLEKQKQMSGGNGGGTFLGERVCALEVKVDHIQSDITEIKQDLRGLSSKVDSNIKELSSKVDSNLKWTIGTLLPTVLLLFTVTMGAFYHLASKIDQMDASLSTQINVLASKYISLNDKIANR